MRKVRFGAAALLTAGLLSFGLAAPANAVVSDGSGRAGGSGGPAGGSTAHAAEVRAARSTCPRGAVCVYPGYSIDRRPTYVFYSYGPHRIHSQYGVHAVFNNQTGGAGAHLCKGSNGTRCDSVLRSGYVRQADLTPVNSVLLTRGG